MPYTIFQRDSGDRARAERVQALEQRPNSSQVGRKIKEDQNQELRLSSFFPVVLDRLLPAVTRTAVQM
jgi:hypothetical protein